MNELKKLLPYIKEHRTKIALVIFCGIIMAACETAITFIAKILMDEIFTNKNKDYLLLVCVGPIALFLVHGIARYLHMYFLKMTAEYITVKLRRELQMKFMNLSLNYHGKNPPGVLLSKTINDLSYIQAGLHKLADAIREPIFMVFLISRALYIDWKLTIVIFTAAPIIVLFLRQLAKSTRKYSHMQHESSEEITTTLKETLDGMRIIQSFNLQSETTNRLNKNMEKYIFTRKKIIAREESNGPITEQVGTFVFAAIVFYMGTQAITGQATGGDFIGYLAAIGFLQKPIKNLQDTYIRIQIMVAAVTRVFGVLNDPDTVPIAASPKKFPQEFSEIDFKNISFHYADSSPLLKNVNLKVKKGEVIALVGESGSGKSTLVNLLERFYDPTAGDIYIDSIRIKDIDLRDLRRNIALVTQDVFLFDDTVANNIRFGNNEKEVVSIEAAASMANAHDFISKSPNGFQSRAGDRGARFSGGEKQRISIARAIYKNAPILILDEATSALDSASELEVQKGLEQLMKGRTVFVIAHRLSTIASADRILVLKNGQIVESGTHQELLNRKGEYHNFYQLQIIT